MQTFYGDHLLNSPYRFLQTGNWVAWLLILAFAILNLICVRRDFSLTTDEDKHYLYGENIVSGDAARFDDSKMPITALNAIPKKLGSLLPDGRLREILSRFYVARAVTILFSCLLAYLVFYWSRSLYGVIPALFSLTLYILDPNIIAHSQLVATDLYVTASISLAYFTFWRFARSHRKIDAVFCVFALGLAQITKYTAIVLYPLFVINLLLVDWPDLVQRFRTGQAGRFFQRYLLYAAFVAFGSAIVINIGFLFQGTFTSFGEYHFASAFFRKIQATLPVLANLPIPTAYPYLQGLDLMQNTEATGVLAGNVYLLGRISTLHGFPGYYFVAYLLKVPLASQIIIVCGLVHYFSKLEWKSLRENEAFFLVPILFFLIYFNFFFNTQIGIRYLLPIFPLMYVFAGSLFKEWAKFRLAEKLATGILLSGLCLSTFSYHPYYLSYFNELVWDRKTAYKYLADSNLDWGQGRKELEQYLQENPSVVYRSSKIQAGHIVVRVNDLVGVSTSPDQYAWLRENFEPADTIAYSYLIYDITPADIETLCATTVYCQP